MKLGKLERYMFARHIFLAIAKLAWLLAISLIHHRQIRTFKNMVKSNDDTSIVASQ